MMQNNKFDIKAIRAWCLDAIKLLSIDELPPHISELRLKIVSECNRKSGMNSLARDCSEGISHLSPEARLIVDEYLISTHGFGHRFFLDKQLSVARKAIERGSIISTNEYRIITDILTDTEIPPDLISALTPLVVDFERPREAKNKNKP